MPRAGGGMIAHGGIERRANPRQRLFLCIDVEARGARLRDQQCAITVAREPDLVALLRPALLTQPVEQVQELAGRVTCKHASHQHARR
jgi:hypothetical protein